MCAGEFINYNCSIVVVLRKMFENISTFYRFIIKINLNLESSNCIQLGLKEKRLAKTGLNYLMSCLTIKYIALNL